MISAYRLKLARPLMTRGFGKLATKVSIKLPNGKEYEQPTGLYLNNQFIPSAQGKTFEVINPASEEIITNVYEAREEDVDAAVDAAEKAFNANDWSVAEPSVRSKAIHKLADLMEENKEVLAMVESMDNGKSLLMSTGDVEHSINCMRYYAHLADYNFGRVVNTGPDSFSFTRREPIGVCGLIVPWNFPLAMWTAKVGPALVTGNTVVIKAAESTPLSALFVSQFIKEAGIPDGVYNLVSGFGKIAGDYMARHDKIQKISFTGSTAVGRTIMKHAADSNLKNVTLELGGKSPNIVFADADLDIAVQNVVMAMFINSGQICIASSRLYVEESIKDEFLKKLTPAIEAIKVGNPFESGVFQGAITSKAQYEKILKYIEIGKSEGATILTGGEKIGDKGFFIKPTVFDNIKPNSKVLKEEIFGPVMVVDTFKTVDEVVAKANDTTYGLAAYIHTKSHKTTVEVTAKLQAGSVWVNTFFDSPPSMPFGGYKQSGFGREHGIEVVDSYTQVKAIRTRLV